MSLSPAEISEIIKEKIEKYHPKVNIMTEGKIVSLSDGIVHIYGLNNAKYGERLNLKVDILD